MARLVATLWVVSCVLFASGGFVAADAQAVGRPTIGDTRVERAPIGERGGLMNPVAWCPGHATQPKVRTVVRGLDNGFRRVWRYRGSYPGRYFPRVEVGRYRLTTKAWCGKQAARRVETVRVEEKTAATTMSRAEYRRIKRGMTPKQVRRIVGVRALASSYRNQLWWTFDLMPFWQYGTVEFRDRRLVRKAWNVGHD